MPAESTPEAEETEATVTEALMAAISTAVTLILAVVIVFTFWQGSSAESHGATVAGQVPGTRLESGSGGFAAAPRLSIGERLTVYLVIGEAEIERLGDLGWRPNEMALVAGSADERRRAMVILKDLELHRGVGNVRVVDRRASVDAETGG